MDKLGDHVDVVLELESLSAGYGDVALIGPVDLALGAGRLVALHGESGSGKTTLLRTVAGLIDACGGGVRLLGQHPQEIGWPRFRRQVIWVSQQPVLMAGTVEQNLRRVFTYRSGGAGSLDLECAQRWLTRLGLGSNILREQAGQLSVGQQQRVALVRAALLGPRVLLLDEPTSALDARSADEVESLLQELAAQRRLSALVVTHQTERATRWAHQQVDLPRVMKGVVP